MQQWGIERQIRGAIKERFDAEGITVPYPRQVVVVRRDTASDELRSGDAPVSEQVPSSSELRKPTEK